MNRRQIFISAAVALGVFTAPQLALAAEPAVYTGILEGVGAGGYDVVSYTQGEPKMGDEKFAVSQDGAKWYFASEANMKAFQADPAKFTPAYGGYCAFAVAKGSTAKGDPEVWSIVDGKLYFNYNKSVQSSWRSDTPGYIAKANANWPKVLQ